MTQVCLVDYDRASRLYHVETGAGFGLSSLRVCKDSPARTQGFCSVRRLGLLCRVKDLIAVFSDGRSLCLGTQGQVYNLSEDTVVAKREKLFPGARRFVLTRGDQVLVSFAYWNIPGRAPQGGDIFEYAERVTQSSKNKADFLEIWNASLSGVDLNDPEVIANFFAHRKAKTPEDSGPATGHDT